MRRNRARRPWPTPHARRRLASPAAVAGSLLSLAFCATNCGFPEYDFQAPGGAAQGGDGPTGGTGDLGGSSGWAGQAAGDSGSANEAGSGGALGGAGGDTGAGAAGAAGAAPGDAPCIFPEPVVFPAHCFDKLLNSGETGADCGGSDCAACSHGEGCLTNADCAGQHCSAQKTCVPVLTLQYTSVDSTSATRAPRFRVQIDYLDETATALNDLKIRYYFNHNGVAEPVIALNSQATFDPGNAQRDISTSMRASVHRALPGPTDHGGRRTDSYVEISFDSFSSLATGSELIVLQDVSAGSSNPPFDQSTHYSFINAGTGMVPNDAITVYRAGERVWGVEPPMNLLPECAFDSGLNVAGRAVQIATEAISAEADEAIVFDAGQPVSNPLSKAFPVTDAGTSALLTTWRTFSTADSALWTVPNGSYWAFAWLTSGPSATSGTLSIQDTSADAFYGSQRTDGAAWALVGPYPIEVTDQTLTLSASGTINLAGLKLYRTRD